MSRRTRRTRKPKDMVCLEHHAADDYIRLQRQIESLQAQAKIMRSELQEFAQTFKDSSATIGKSHLSIRIVGPDAVGSIVFAWRETYTTPKIDAADLLPGLGEHAARFTRRYEQVKLDKGVTLAVLRKVIGDDALDALVECDLIDVKIGVLPTKGAMAGVAELFALGEEDAAAALFALVDANAPAPQCKTKHPVAGGVKHAAK